MLGTKPVPVKVTWSPMRAFVALALTSQMGIPARALGDATRTEMATATTMARSAVDRRRLPDTDIAVVTTSG